MYSSEMVAELHYIDLREPPHNRRDTCSGDHEHHLTEAAVMVAFAMHLFDLGADRVMICPDREHVKRHDLAKTLARLGFTHAKSIGKTTWAGHYRRNDQLLEVKSISGKGDVSGECDGVLVVAECKGGIVNTKHSGQSSRLRKGLCEAVGQLLGRVRDAERHIVVVPDAIVTRALAKRMMPRVRAAGIEIALINGSGHVSFCSS